MVKLLLNILSLPFGGAACYLAYLQFELASQDYKQAILFAGIGWILTMSAQEYPPITYKRKYKNTLAWTIQN